MTQNDPQQSQSVTLSLQDWQTILAGLYELPAKFGIGVIARLQNELNRPQAAEDPGNAEVTQLRRES